MLDDNFIRGFRVFWKSFIRHNKWFNYDFIVIDSGLSETVKKELHNTYKKIIIRDVIKDNYKKINLKKTKESLRKTFWKLEVFRQTDYDRLIFLDMDILIMSDISELFKFDDGIIAGCKCFFVGKDMLTDDINTGVFVLNKPAIHRQIYKDLLTIAIPGSNSPDQNIINFYFKNQIKYFNKSYNIEKRVLHTRKHKHLLDNIKILHFVATKPWQKIKPNRREKQYKQLESLWLKYENSINNIN
jgi:glycogenin glucosyltransferase